MSIYIVEELIQSLLSQSTEDTSKQWERLAFSLFSHPRRMSSDTAGFSQWGGRGWAGGGAKNVVISLLTGFSREFRSSLRRMAAHPKGSDTPSCSDPRLPFNADATTRSAFSEKYLISLLLFPSRKGSFLSNCLPRVLQILPHCTFRQTLPPEFRDCRGSAGADPDCLVGRKRGFTPDELAVYRSDGQTTTIKFSVLNLPGTGLFHCGKKMENLS